MPELNLQKFFLCFKAEKPLQINGFWRRFWKVTLWKSSNHRLSQCMHEERARRSAQGETWLPNQVPHNDLHK